MHLFIECRLEMIIQAEAVLVFHVVPVIVGVIDVQIERGGNQTQREAYFIFPFHGGKLHSRIGIKRSEDVGASFDQPVDFGISVIIVSVAEAQIYTAQLIFRINIGFISAMVPVPVFRTDDDFLNRGDFYVGAVDAVFRRIIAISDFRFHDGKPGNEGLRGISAAKGCHGCGQNNDFS